MNQFAFLFIFYLLTSARSGHSGYAILSNSPLERHQGNYSVVLSSGTSQ